MVGPLATAGQQVNTELINALYQLWSPLSKVILSYSQTVQDILSANIAVCVIGYRTAIEYLLIFPLRDLERAASVLECHYAPFQRDEARTRFGHRAHT